MILYVLVIKTFSENKFAYVFTELWHTVFYLSFQQYFKVAVVMLIFEMKN